MPRYFFHVHDGADQPDPTGTEFADFKAARGEAVRACGEMLRDIDGDLPIGSEWRMDVADETGRTILTLRFSQTVPPA
jgi:hypothetical protein